MHAINSSPTPSYPSSDSANEALAALIASLFLSRPSTRSFDSSSKIPSDNRIDWVNFTAPHNVSFPRSDGNVPLPTHLDVTQLPVEIICEIFEKFMEDDELYPTFDDTPIPVVSHTCRSDPTKLGQICSRWRAVAINLPKLWSNILIYNPKSSQTHLTDVWLERSGSHPLNLEMNYDRGKRNYDVGSAARMLQSFIAHLGRWKRFRLDMSIELLRPLYPIVLSPHKPLILESVSFEFYNSYDYHHAEEHINTLWKYFHGCPTLRQVVWSGDEVKTFPKYALSQLTHVHARFSVSIDDILSFLPQVPLIEELQIESLRLGSTNAPAATSPHLLLPHLRLLRIRSYNVPASSFISRLICPSLEILEINHRNFRPQSTQDLQEIPQFLNRSGCRLKKLDLRDPGIDITDDELKRCLSESPLQSLTSLYLLADNLSDQTVMLLARKSSDGSHEFAPFLENLGLPVCDASDGLLASMVSSRWHEPLDDNRSTPLGYLREVDIDPKKDFGPIDEAFFLVQMVFNDSLYTYVH